MFASFFLHFGSRKIWPSMSACLIIAWHHPHGYNLKKKTCHSQLDTHWTCNICFVNRSRTYWELTLEKKLFFLLCLCNIQNASAALIGVGEKWPSDISSDVLTSRLTKGQTQQICSLLSSRSWHLLWLGRTQLTGDCRLRDSSPDTEYDWNWTQKRPYFS